MEKILPYIELLENNKNLIFTGAPGTGKTYLAKQIAREMIGLKDDENLEDSEQFEFVQFHPSYDYTDFVEGLRPIKEKEQKEIGFELKDGIFKKFCENAYKGKGTLTENINEIFDNEETFNYCLKRFYEEVKNDEVELSKQDDVHKDDEFEKWNIKLPYTTVDDKESHFYVQCKKDSFKVSAMYSENKKRNHSFFNYCGKEKGQDTFRLLEYKEGILQKQECKWDVNFYFKLRAVLEYWAEHYMKKYIFIIDEINRAEISKVFGELFFSIDPGYRGKKGIVKTQYHNLVESRNDNYVFKKGFFIPENVYIIGTMNDIDRSVESMDFAMRRRFAWQEITPEDTMKEIFKELGELKDGAEKQLNRLNKKIKEELGAEYQIGGAYFLKLNNYINYDDSWGKLWDNHLKGVLSEYLRGFQDADKKLDDLENVYNNEKEIVNGQNNG